MMGCDVSKNTDVVENIDNEDEMGEFTETQIDTIRSTWPILARDMLGIGGKVFLRIFLEEPKLKKIFKSFGELEDHELMDEPVFQEHVTKFMQVVDTLVDNLDNPKAEIQQLLMMLGARHATFEGFDVAYFPVYTKALLEVWETEIGEEFIVEVRDCWSFVFSYITKHICLGYDLYLSECKREFTEEKT